MRPIYAYKPGMSDIARQMERKADDFNRTTRAVNSTAATLAGTWEGVSKEQFVLQNQLIQEQFQEMERMVREYVASIHEAVEKYTDTDEECARLLRSV